jgi:hypothetical protein
MPSMRRRGWQVPLGALSWLISANVGGDLMPTHPTLVVPRKPAR